MRILCNLIILVFFYFPNKIINSFKIHGNLKHCNKILLNIYKETNESKTDIIENNILKSKKRYSFSPVKRNTIEDIKKRIKFNEKIEKEKKKKFFKKKDIHKSLIEDIKKENINEEIKSLGRINTNDDWVSQNILPLPVEKSEETYNCLILCKGVPFNIDNSHIKNFFKPYEIIDKYIIYIKDKKGNFFGDVFVRFLNKEQKYLALKNKNYKFLLHRYIQLFNINEEHYEEYFNIGYKNPPSYKNYVPIKNIIVSNNYDFHEKNIITSYNNYDKDEDTEELREKVNKNGILLKNIYTGKKLKGRITSVHTYGVFIDCDVYIKNKNNKFIKILALLHKNKLTINVGLPFDPLCEQEKKELILQKNMNIIVYVDKIIKKNEDFNRSDDPNKNNLIFFNLTLDSSITEEKIEWLQKLKLKRGYINRIIDSNNNESKTNASAENYSKLLLNSDSCMEKLQTEIHKIKENNDKNTSENMCINEKVSDEKIKNVNEQVLKPTEINNEKEFMNDNCRYVDYEEGSIYDQNFNSRTKEKLIQEKNKKYKRDSKNRISKIYLMNNLNHENNYTDNKSKKQKKNNKLRSLNKGKNEIKEQIIGKKKKFKLNVKKIKKKKKNSNTSYDEYENIDDIFPFYLINEDEENSKKGKNEENKESEGNQESEENQEDINRTNTDKNTNDKEGLINKEIKKNLTEKYNDEMNSILKNIYSSHTERNISANHIDSSRQKKEREDKKKKILKVSKNVNDEHKSNSIMNENENTNMGCFERIHNREKWKNDIRKEESSFYSRIFGFNTDINDFYSNDIKENNINEKCKKLNIIEENIKLNENEIKYENMDYKNSYLVCAENLENEEKSGREEKEKRSKVGEEEGKEVERGEMKHLLSNKELNESKNNLNYIINYNNDSLDFSNFSELSLEELKKEIYKRNYLLPIEISIDSLRNRLIQIYICEKNNVDFDNFPIIRYYLFDFYLSIEDIKTLILSNRKFLNKKSIDKKLLDTLKINELKYLLHKAMENFRLWEPDDSIKRKILNFNKDLLLKQNLHNVDNINKKNLIILWNDFKDFMLNYVYRYDSKYDSYENIGKNDENNKNSTTNIMNNSNISMNKYIKRVKEMDKKNFFFSSEESFIENLENQMNKEKQKDSFKNSLIALNQNDENENELPDKINLKEAMKLLNNRAFQKKAKRSLNDESNEKENKDYIKKIIHVIIKNKKYFKENLNEEILKKIPYEELIFMLDKLPVDAIEELL
ncbi:conserved Plasmodium protein, unknown function [Plasmodium relictum]|uniref:RRM domain-containing protein n=1 Tax=Plasmodium relictum TaxID=85471 RepID=A0A1J1HBM7_PLARL|nr:conserved Plasmodium protein, unknown function [Plasmodium relictum]CRH02860.1 conserved Plasmodium protein, unknown function [Plasmodium relictum]